MCTKYKKESEKLFRKLNRIRDFCEEKIESIETDELEELDYAYGCECTARVILEIANEEENEHDS